MADRFSDPSITAITQWVGAAQDVKEVNARGACWALFAQGFMAGRGGDSDEAVIDAARVFVDSGFLT